MWVDKGRRVRGNGWERAAGTGGFVGLKRDVTAEWSVFWHSVKILDGLVAVLDAVEVPVRVVLDGVMYL